MGAGVNFYEYNCALMYLLSKKRVYKSELRFCGETDITLDYGSRIQGSNPCRTANLNF
tara:strand:+ start:136 stop:309 length:174 start_codon:yes stop_codon:yes gene_type:complete